MYRKSILLAAVLTFIVVVVGAYVRLSDAGLGCPDWPGCYGQITPEHAEESIAEAVRAQGGEHGPVSIGKAWREMGHRYIAGTLGLLLLGIAIASWVQKRPRGLPTLLVGVVIVQASLGMWTVTLLLKPVIVTLHLLGGMTIFALLTLLLMRQYEWPQWRSGEGAAKLGALKGLALIGLLLAIAQIMLGGWVSSNYAALACPDLPLCRGRLVPPMDIGNAFHVLRELGMTAQGELLSVEALTAIHWMHRVGAIVVFCYSAFLGIRLMQTGVGRPLGMALKGIVLLQFTLGILNVIFSLPLPLAAAHNAGALLLLGGYVVINYATRIAACASARNRAPAIPAASDTRTA